MLERRGARLNLPFARDLAYKSPCLRKLRLPSWAIRIWSAVRLVGAVH